MTARPRPEILEIDPYVGGESTAAGRQPGHQALLQRGRVRRAAGRPCAAMRGAAAELHRYPTAAATELRRAIGARFGLDPARIVCGAGSDDLIYQLCLVLWRAGHRDRDERARLRHLRDRRQLCRRQGAQGAGARADGRCGRDAGAVSPATRIVFLANPNNPTGTMVSAAEMARLRAGLPPEVLLVLDSAYAEYVDRPDYDPGVALVDAGDNTVMTRTFSKIFGLGGMRIGWCYAPAAIVDVLNRVRGPFNVNVAGAGGRRSPRWRSRAGWSAAARTTREWRAWLADGARRRPGSRSGRARAISCSPISARGARPRRRTRSCAARGMIVRARWRLGLPHCLRITVGTEEECGWWPRRSTDFMGMSRVAEAAVPPPGADRHWADRQLGRAHRAGARRSGRRGGRQRAHARRRSIGSSNWASPIAWRLTRRRRWRARIA